VSEASAALALELTYRSDAALLVAYATYLTRGQLVFETSARIASGTPLQLQLVAPAASVALTGVVTRGRGDGDGSAQVGEVSLTVTSRAELLGEAVDKLAFGFKGLKALVAASQAAPRALLIRYLRSIVTCEVIEIDQSKLSEPGAICNVDLAVIDLDSTGAAGYELYARLREHPEAGSAPVLAVAQLERDRARAASLGFDEALGNPPAFADLQTAALRCLAKPARVKLV
jgi:CheY-like chemotaxis protein